MGPVLCKFGALTIYTYGVFVAFAFFVVSFLLSREARRTNTDENMVYNLCLLLLMSGIAGARFFYVALNAQEFSAHPFEILMLNHGGLVWFGGFFGAAAAFVVFVRRKNVSLVGTLDLFAPYVALGQAIGRIGCFFNGCCYGKPSSWGVYFPIHGEKLFPSQLVDAATLFVLFVVLQKMKSRQLPKGLIFGAYLMGAGIQRFCLEFLRGDPKPFYGSFSIFQWISLCVFVAGVVIGAFLWKKKAA
jgi:phosphatidylglycerol:prolipoprotein diacylglycerol transferase